jgi:hypothetical protein
MPGGAGPDPQLRYRGQAEPHGLAEVEDPAEAQGSEHSVVEGRAGGHISALDGDMVDHRDILPANGCAMLDS